MSDDQLGAWDGATVHGDPRDRIANQQGPVTPPAGEVWDHIIIELIPGAWDPDRAQIVCEWLARNVGSVKLAAPAMIHEGSLIPKGKAVRGVNAG